MKSSLIAFLIFGASIIFLGGCTDAGVSEDEYQQLTEHVDSLASEVQSLEASLASIESRLWGEGYLELREELIAEGKYPKDKQEQEQWIIAAMRATGPQGEANAVDYEWMLDAYENNRAGYDQLRNLAYMDAIFRWAEQLRLDMPTVDQVLYETRKDKAIPETLLDNLMSLLN